MVTALELKQSFNFKIGNYEIEIGGKAYAGSYGVNVTVDTKKGVKIELGGSFNYGIGFFIDIKK